MKLSILPFVTGFAALAAATPLHLSLRSITCLKTGATATATWVNSAGQTCHFTGVVGSNYGVNAAGGEYSCNGRCGAGCDGPALGNVYTADCFSHDVCSFFENAKGGASDPNCGAAFKTAADDTLLGGLTGCGQISNPVKEVEVPGGKPVCV